MNQKRLDNGKKYVKELFSSAYFYNVPEYQRPYVWSDDQVNTLLDDLSKAYENDNQKEYFLGCMIWNTKPERDKHGKEYPAQDILDGQQRFISLYLLQAVIRDLSNEAVLKRKVMERLVQEEDEYDNIPRRDRILFSIREDSKFLTKYVLEKNGTLDIDALKQIHDNEEMSVSVRNMAGALVTMHAWWKDKKVYCVNKYIDFHEYLTSFYRYLSNNVLILYLATPDNLDDAYNLFTVLNSRGLQLQVGDILKAQNLREISNKEERKEYAQKWTQLEDAIGEPFKSLDAFLWSFIYMKMKYSSDENKSVTLAFEFMYKKGTLKKGKDTIDELCRYVEQYTAIADGELDTKETGVFFKNLHFILKNTFGDQYLTPMMLYRLRFHHVHIHDFFIKLDNLLSVAWLSGRRISQTRIFVILRRIDEIYNDWKDGKYASVEEATKDLIESPELRYDYEDERYSAKPINIQDFFDFLDEEKWGSYSGVKINKIKYLLLKTDLILANIRTNLEYNRGRSSVEHLMPRNTKHWDVDPELHAEWLHRIGNLVLLDRRKNASLSNGSFAKKIDRYQTSFDTRPNTNRVFVKYKDWNIDTIKENHKWMLNLLRKYYTASNYADIQRLQKNQNKPLQHTAQ